MKEISLLGGVPPWVIGLAAAAAAVFLVFHFLQLRRRLSPARAWLLIGLRGLVYGALLVFLANPALVERRAAHARPALFVGIDSSQSMGLPAAPGGPSRLELVQRKLGELGSALARLGEFYDLRWYAVSGEAEPLAPARVGRLTADGNASRLWRFLSEARRAGAAGVLVLSDGIANGEAFPEEPSRLSPPVIAVASGSAEGYRDIRIKDLRLPEFAFRGRELKIELTVEAHGFRGQTLSLFFNRGPSLVATRALSVDRDAYEHKVTFSYAPREIGAHAFSVSTAVQPGEAISRNNKKDFQIDVRRDKIRVLTLSGAPSWNYRFLRMALKQDPFIDLVSFVFLRTPTDSVDVPDSELSLIPFPTDEIFLEELKNFDVVVFDDFSHRSYFNMLYLEKVRDFVRAGGGLAMLGGVRSFDSGEYRDSPLAEVLPVILDGKGRYRAGGAVRARLAAAGKNHPVTRLAAEGAANEEAWSRLPPLTRYNEVAGVRGEVLLAAAANGAAARPLLAVGKYGKGRTLALMSDDFWRWSFVALGQRQTPQHHLQFVRQAVRWLSQEPSLEQVQVLPVAGASPGEKVKLRARVLKEDFTPAPQADVRLFVVTPEGERLALEARSEGEEYAAEFTPAREGSYRIEAQAELAGKPLGKAGRSFDVAYPHGEGDDGKPRPDLLREIAAKSGGTFMSIGELGEASLNAAVEKLKREGPQPVFEVRQLKLWNHLWVFSGLLALLCADWWLRRRWGLV